MSGGWTVRKAADLLEPGERFVFADELGGENEVVTVVSVASRFGTTDITTEELDFDIEVLSKQWVTMAQEEEDDRLDVLMGYSALLGDQEEQHAQDEA